jgi:mercuric ion transport protein
MSNTVDALPLACVPAAIPAAERSAHFALARTIFTELATQRQDLRHGYAFRFDAAHLESLSRFIANECKCCPFMTFELEIAAASGPIWLRMTGPEGTRDVLEAELRLASIAPASGCGCGTSDVINSQPSSTARANRLVRWTTAGGIFAALGICAACCLLPFVLLSLGIAGAWVSALDSLAPYKWIFIAAAALLLGYGFYAVYRKPRHCTAGPQCEECLSNRPVRMALWIGTALAVGGIAFEQLEPYLVH